MPAVQTSTQGPLQYVCGRFRDFDEFSAAIRGWDLAFRQLDCGPSPADLVEISAPGTHLHRVSLSRIYDQRGESPQGMRTFGFVFDGSEGVRWRGKPLSDTEICSFGPTGGFESISRPGFGCWTLSVAEDRLAEVADMIGPGRGPGGLPEARIRFVDTLALRGLRDRLQRLAAELETRPDALKSEALGEELAFEIPAQLLSTLESTDEPTAKPRARERDRAMRRAREFIEEHAGGPLTIRELCRATGVSWRTLNYAFEEQIGVTPKAYLTAIRLHGVRRALRDADEHTVIADLANRWGFWHMGQFAADYRRHFKELPSQTMGRAIGRSSPNR